MNAQRSSNIFKRMYLSHPKINLGRWNIHNDSQTIIKIKYANEDNCGLSSNNENIKQVHQNNKLDDGYEPTRK